MSFSLISAGLPVLSFLVLAGSAAELTIAARFQDFAATQNLCGLYLCEEDVVATHAYNLQLKGDAPSSLAAAIPLLEQLLVRDSAAPQRWVDLGDAWTQAGAIVKARHCFSRALDLGHHSARILIAAADFYLHHGDRRQGLGCLSRILATTADFDRPVFGYFSAADVGLDKLLAYGLPQDKRAAQSYLRYLMRQPALSDARKLWNWMTVHALTDERIVVEYANFLSSQSRLEEAADTWASQFRYRTSGYRTTQYAYNGDFEYEPSAVAFDWNISPLDHVDVMRDSQAHSGRWSLRIRFDGTANVDYSHISQRTVLRTGKYRFQAYVRTDAITTNQGVFFRIFDAEAPNRLTIETEPLLGTNAWHAVGATFVASPLTRLVEIRVMRRPSLRFDNKISGTVWIDGVSLARAG